MVDDTQQFLHDIIQKALKSGASAADAVMVNGTSLSVGWRGGKLETLEQADGEDLGLRVLIGKKQAVVSSTDLRQETLDELVGRAVSMARLAPEDPYCGIADPSEIARDYPTIDLADAYEIDAPFLIQKAREAEEAALSVSGIAQVESTDAGGSQTRVTLAASNGFSGTYQRTRYSLSAVTLAGTGTEMERDGEGRTVTHLTDLPQPEDIGRRAADKTLRHLGARKMPTCQVPVVFDKDEAGALIGEFVGAILGSGVARGVSFLKDSLGQKVFPEAITIIDDPFRARGLRSKAFDAEGLLPSRRTIVEKGVLTTWIMDLRSARQLRLKSTGHASRGTSGVPSPSPTNVYLEPGGVSLDALMADIKQGFYVTETMGMGVNDVTGDYSLAARGFWIENGQIAFPVNEMTIASNLKDMFLNLTAANDLEFRHGIDSPTLRIEGMTVAGI